MSSEKKSTAIRDAALARADVYTVDPTLIDIKKGFNPRDYSTPQNKAHIQNLAASIKEEGVQEPLWVTYDPATGRFTLVNGESRLRAVRALIKAGVEIKGVPVLRKSGSEAEILALALTANTGKAFSKPELGAAFKRLIDFGWTTRDIGARWNMTTTQVDDCIVLTQADDEVKALLAEGAVTPAYAASEIKKRGTGATLVIKAAVTAATTAATKPKKEAPAAEPPAADSTGAPAKKRGRPKKDPKDKKVKPVTRAKKKGGEFIRDADLELIRSALKLAAASDDVNISSAATTALEKLPESDAPEIII